MNIKRHVNAQMASAQHPLAFPVDVRCCEVGSEDFFEEALAVLHTFRSHEKFSNPPQLGSETFFPDRVGGIHFPMGAPVSPL